MNHHGDSIPAIYKKEKITNEVESTDYRSDSRDAHLRLALLSVALVLRVNANCHHEDIVPQSHLILSVLKAPSGSACTIRMKAGIYTSASINKVELIEQVLADEEESRVDRLDILIDRRDSTYTVAATCDGHRRPLHDVDQ